MRCPYCLQTETRVVESRELPSSIRRRRECEKCTRRFTTYERIVEALPAVVKADGRREPFDRDKIEKGVAAAAAKRPVSTEQLAALAEEVEREICELGKSEVTAREIGERVLPRLRTLDEVAYVRFASIYRDFRDVDEFLKELGDLVKRRDD